MYVKKTEPRTAVSPVPPEEKDPICVGEECLLSVYMYSIVHSLRFTALTAHHIVLVIVPHPATEPPSHVELVMILM